MPRRTNVSKSPQDATASLGSVASAVDPSASASTAAASALSEDHAGTSATADSHQEGSKKGSRGKHKRKNKGKPEGEAACKKPFRPRPTHFIALPLSHPDLHARIKTLTSALLAAAVPVEGLDKSIVIEGVRMHLTIGVMPLESQKATTTKEADAIDQPVEAEGASLESEEPITVDSVLARLNSLRPQILELLNGEALKVTLGGADVMKVRKRRRKPAAGNQTQTDDSKEDPASQVPQEEYMEVEEGADDGGAIPEDNGNHETGDQVPEIDNQADFEEFADVLYASVPESVRENSRVWEVGRLIEDEFKKAGFITDTRPLKLHLTILNTSHRKPRRRYLPFSYSAVKSVIAAGPSQSPAAEASEAGTMVADLSSTSATPNQWSHFGTWEVGSIELWVMGSRDKEGRDIVYWGLLHCECLLNGTSYVACDLHG